MNITNSSAIENLRNIYTPKLLRTYISLHHKSGQKQKNRERIIEIKNGCLVLEAVKKDFNLRFLDYIIICLKHVSNKTKLVFCYFKLSKNIFNLRFCDFNAQSSYHICLSSRKSAQVRLP